MPFSIELDEEYWCPLSVNASIYSRMEYSVLRGKVCVYERYEFQGFGVGILGLQLEEYVNDPTTILLPNHPYCWALNFFRHLTKVIEVTYSACLCRIISSCPVNTSQTLTVPSKLPVISLLLGCSSSKMIGL